MNVEVNTKWVIFTNSARCRDCYRCVRVCPVKAIRIAQGQASVDEARCIGCGTCIRECPQSAKTYRRDIDKAEQIIASHALVAVSLAPSFAGLYEEWEWSRLPAALRRLGFRHVAETAVGAYLVARAAGPLARAKEGRSICTACPALVNYVEKYVPEKMGDLMPLVSPMIAHAKHIKLKYGLETRVVFIGPCVAKKIEAERREFKGLIDCVLTFEELREWMSRRGIRLEACEESDFDEKPCGSARLFPLEGGELATMAIERGGQDDSVVSVSGAEQVQECLGLSQNGSSPCLVEPLMCPQGCISGAGIGKEGNVFDRRAKVIRYGRRERAGAKEPDVIDISTTFQAHPARAAESADQESVLRELALCGKARTEDQLNCGACGYRSCREQAAAVVSGMAEREMCMPYMRRLAEQRSDRIMETSPNAIVILDQQLNILNCNPAFSSMFRTDSGCRGRHISHLMDPLPFEKVACGQTELFDETRPLPERGLIVRAVVYALRNEKQYVGIFSQIAAQGADAVRLQKIKDETVEQARELYAHQIEMAQQMANCLGEYSARGEMLLQKLVQVVEERQMKEKKIP